MDIHTVFGPFVDCGVYAWHQRGPGLPGQVPANTMGMVVFLHSCAHHPFIPASSPNSTPREIFFRSRMKSDLALNRTVFLAAMLVPPVRTPTPSGGISTTTWGKSTDVESFETHEMLKLDHGVGGASLHAQYKAGQSRASPQFRKWKFRIQMRRWACSLRVSSGHFPCQLVQSSHVARRWHQPHTEPHPCHLHLKRLDLLLVAQVCWARLATLGSVHSHPTVILCGARVLDRTTELHCTRVQGQPGYHHVGRYCGGALLCARHLLEGSAALHR